MVVKHINMQWTIVIGLLIVGSLHAGGDDLPTLGESVETISKLEHAGKWKEALPIYRQLYEEARHAIDGLSVKFMLKKGICELQYGEFNDAEKSFEKGAVTLSLKRMPVFDTAILSYLMP